MLLIHGFSTVVSRVPGRHAKHALRLEINTTNHENLTLDRIELINNKALASR